LKTFRLFFIYFTTLVLFACSQAPPSAPACRVATDYASDHVGSAACLIRITDGLLVIQRDDSGYYDLPSGQTISEETSQCTAHQQMWLQTGLNVRVAQLLSINRDGMRIYACALGGGFDGAEEYIQPPSWVQPHVDKIRFIDPFVTRDAQWHYPKDLIVIRDGYVALGHSPVLTDQQINAVEQPDESY